ncbi:MAG: hypothetical protein ACLFWD_10470 [Anaerolineales bacterium]
MVPGTTDTSEIVSFLAMRPDGLGSAVAELADPPDLYPTPTPAPTGTPTPPIYLITATPTSTPLPTHTPTSAIWLD